MTANPTIVAAATGAAVGGLLSLISLVVREWLDRRKEQRTRQETEVERMRLSDAACWRQLQGPLSNLWWETERMAPGVKFGQNGERIISPIVDAPTMEWMQAANAVSKAIGQVYFHDPECRDIVDTLWGAARMLAQAASEAASFRDIVRDLQTSTGVDRGEDAIQLNDKAIGLLGAFRDLMKQANEVAARRLGFDLIFDK